MIEPSANHFDDEHVEQTRYYEFALQARMLHLCGELTQRAPKAERRRVLGSVATQMHEGWKLTPKRVSPGILYLKLTTNEVRPGAVTATTQPPLCEPAGAEGATVLDHSKFQYLKELIALTKGRGVDVIIEMLANQNLTHDLSVLAPRRVGDCR